MTPLFFSLCLSLFSHLDSTQMETIISSHLAELDITTDNFYEACQSSRSSRDINRAVFEKMLAMEDFTVFKKIMVKRNMELQYEAMQSYKHFHEVSQYGLESDLSHLPDPDELEAMLENREEDVGQGKSYEQVHSLHDSLFSSCFLFS
jgi:succinate dehydrogenase flavin-adding protein (antitoxin of CptAB toxin-antitoxin module)